MLHTEERRNRDEQRGSLSEIASAENRQPANLCSSLLLCYSVWISSRTLGDLALLLALGLIRQVPLVADFLDLMQLRFEPVDVQFFVLQQERKQLA